jgi:transposase
LSFTGPDELRERLSGLSAIMLPREAATLRPRAGGDIVTYATKLSIQTLARRVLALDEEVERIDELLGELVAKTAPSLLALHGVGVEGAATLLAAAGDNPQRLRSEATWAHLCGVSPIEASSGKVTRHRLNRGGDRQANSALWRIVMVRMVSHPPTRAYVERRSKEGRSKLEIIRMLKRYVAREVYKHLPRA